MTKKFRTVYYVDVDRAAVRAAQGAVMLGKCVECGMTEYHKMDCGQRTGSSYLVVPPSEDEYQDLRPIEGEEKYIDWDNEFDSYGIFGELSGFCYAHYESLELCRENYPDANLS